MNGTPDRLEAFARIAGRFFLFFSRRGFPGSLPPAWGGAPFPFPRLALLGRALPPPPVLRVFLLFLGAGREAFPFPLLPQEGGQ